MSLSLHKMPAQNLRGLGHAFRVGVVAECPGLSSFRNAARVLRMGEVITDQLRAFLQRTVGDNLVPNGKQIIEIVLMVRHQQRATPRGFKEPHVIGVGLRDINVMIDGDLGPAKSGEHIAPPDFTVEACLFDSGGAKRVDAVPPTFQRNELGE